jgi:Peptidase C39 family
MSPWRSFLRPFVIVLAFDAAASAGNDKPPVLPKVPEKSGDSGFSCGTLALAAMLRLEGRPADIDRVRSLLPDRPAHSLSELRDAGLALGLKLRGVHLSRRDWPLDRPALVHLDRNDSGHFVVIRPVGNTGLLVQMIDSVHGVEVMDVKDLFASGQWTGAALVPSRSVDWVPARLGLVVGLSLLVITIAILVRRVLQARYQGRISMASP